MTVIERGRPANGRLLRWIRSLFLASVLYFLGSIIWHNLVAEEPLPAHVWPQVGDVITNQKDGEHITFVQVSDPDGSGVTVLELRIRSGGRGPRAHVHPDSREVFHVLSGRLDLIVDGQPRVLDAGQTDRVSGGQSHRFYNSSDVETVFRVTIDPGGQMPRALKEVHSFLAQTKKIGIHETLQMMRFADAYNVFMGGLPVWFQKFGLFALVPTARLLGYRPSVLMRIEDND